MATKIFPYAVIWNGEYIPANTPIEIEEEKPVEVADEAVETGEKPVEVAEKPKKRGAK